MRERKLMKAKSILGAALVMTAFVTNATLFSTNWSTPFVNGTTVPDNNPSGWSDTRSLAGLSGTIQDINVTLDLANGWNGDLYAYLVHGDGFAVLLDRVGYSGSGVGYGNTGFDVTLGLSGNPIESYQSFSPSFNGSGQLEGTWAAHSGLSTFVGLAPNGSWSLFIADLSGGGVTTVQSWGLQMDIVAVPEVETWVAAALAGLFGAFWLNRQIWGARRQQ
jgi:subtilisin-like proprotein convertase family protein